MIYCFRIAPPSSLSRMSYITIEIYSEINQISIHLDSIDNRDKNVAYKDKKLNFSFKAMDQSDNVIKLHISSFM